MEMKDCLQFEKKRETEVEGGGFSQKQERHLSKKGVLPELGRSPFSSAHHTVKAQAEEPPRVR